MGAELAAGDGVRGRLQLSRGAREGLGDRPRHRVAWPECSRYGTPLSPPGLLCVGLWSPTHITDDMDLFSVLGVVSFGEHHAKESPHFHPLEAGSSHAAE